MKKTALAVIAFVAMGVSSASADRPCLRFGYIYDWKPLDNRTLIVEDESHKKFRLKLIGVCNNLLYHEKLAFQSRGSLALSCVSLGDQVITHDFGAGPERCAVTKIEAYTPEMEQADRAAQAAKGHPSGY